MTWVWARVLMGLFGIIHAAAAYFYFSKEDKALVWAGAWLLFTALCVWWLPAWPVAATTILLIAVVCWSIWWASIQAAIQRDWVIENARQATGTIIGDSLTVHNFRNFDWRGRHDFTAHWEERVFDLTALTAVDLFVCTWDSPRIAHLIVSFVFANATPLAFSIEVRRETTEKWSMLAGLMKSFELIMIAADERDVVRVRTNFRGEQVYRYRLRTTPKLRRKLIEHYVAEINDLAAHPRFYNTFFRNCTTEIIRILRVAGRSLPLDWRLLISGYVPQYLYRIGMIETDKPFAELQAEANIVARAQAADGDMAFSERIR